MGFKKPDVTDVKMQLLKAHGEICSPYNDGYTTWELKKELYDIKWLLEEMLKRQPTFNDEDKWLEEQEKKRVWSELKR
jgi:translation elongation factor P/translation initiation factor 5A